MVPKTFGCIGPSKPSAIFPITRLFFGNRSGAKFLAPRRVHLFSQPQPLPLPPMATDAPPLVNDPPTGPEWQCGPFAPGQRGAWGRVLSYAVLVWVGALYGMALGCIETIDNYTNLACDTEHPCKGSLTCLEGLCSVPPDKLSCANDSDCKKLGGGLCNLTDNRCYGCLTDADCNGGRCNALYFCQPCLVHCDCGPGGFCDATGAVYYCRLSDEPDACPTHGKETNATPNE